MIKYNLEVKAPCTCLNQSAYYRVKGIELLNPIEKIDMNRLKNKSSVLGNEGMAWENSKQIVINWSVMSGTLKIIAARAAAICKLKRDRRKSINGILLRMQQLKREMLSSVLYPNRPNLGEEIVMNSTEEAEVELPPVEEVPLPPVSERRTVLKKTKP